MPQITRQRGIRPGRHHVGTPGDIISECPGDFVGIRNLRSLPLCQILLQESPIISLIMKKIIIRTAATFALAAATAPVEASAADFTNRHGLEGFKPQARHRLASRA
jgi:hypothetical protein